LNQPQLNKAALLVQHRGFVRTNHQASDVLCGVNAGIRFGGVLRKNTR